MKIQFEKYKELIKEFVQPTEISPQILEKFNYLEGTTKRNKQLVEEFRSVVDSVKGVNKQEIENNMEALKEDVRKQLEAAKTKANDVDDKLMEVR